MKKLLICSPIDVFCSIQDELKENTIQYTPVDYGALPDSVINTLNAANFRCDELNKGFKCLQIDIKSTNDFVQALETMDSNSIISCALKNAKTIVSTLDYAECDKTTSQFTNCIIIVIYCINNLNNKTENNNGVCVVQEHDSFYCYIIKTEEEKKIEGGFLDVFVGWST